MHTGANRFPCGGRCVTAGHVWVRNVTWSITLGVLAMFFAVDGVYLWREASPAYPLVVAVVALVCCSALLRVSLTDPGIIPRGLEEEAHEEGTDLAA